ncbi:hypothetical protein Pelo_7283 [Pelomyxa schiedti]|nr:hypothetical protein Pelo_7283 [Pelomyxa schiedti]
MYDYDCRWPYCNGSHNGETREVTASGYNYTDEGDWWDPTVMGGDLWVRVFDAGALSPREYLSVRLTCKAWNDALKSCGVALRKITEGNRTAPWEVYEQEYVGYTPALAKVDWVPVTKFTIGNARLWKAETKRLKEFSSKYNRELRTFRKTIWIIGPNHPKSAPLVLESYSGTCESYTLTLGGIQTADTTSPTPTKNAPKALLQSALHVGISSHNTVFPSATPEESAVTARHLLSCLGLPQTPQMWAMFVNKFDFQPLHHLFPTRRKSNGD